MYLERFVLPLDKESDIIFQQMCYNGGKYGYIDNDYPCNLFVNKQLYELNFEPITILYGGNGSGKSTLLNLIANKLQLNRIAPFNTSELFDTYTKNCKYELGFDDEGFRHKIPNGSRIITSDDIFDYMLTVRTNNIDIAERIEIARDEWSRLKYGEKIKFNGMDDYEDYRLQVLANQKSLSRRRFIQKVVGKEVKLNSNGETALEYFSTKMKKDTLYCLDEPENSLSPKLQLELASMLEEMVRYCGCQLIIATHSPFLLSLAGARIYDLDEVPVDIKHWWEVENTKIYYNFFKKNKALFEEND